MMAKLSCTVCTLGNLHQFRLGRVEGTECRVLHAPGVKAGIRLTVVQQPNKLLFISANLRRVDETMAKASKLLSSGRALLLGATLSAGSLAACVPVTPAQRADFNQALTSKRPQDINAFLRKYPDSELSASMLNNLSPASLRRVSRSAVTSLAPTTQRKLSPAVCRQMGIADPKSCTGVRGKSKRATTAAYDG